MSTSGETQAFGVRQGAKWRTAGRNHAGRPGGTGRGDEGQATTVPTIFETSRPREDVLKGTIAEADFAADLAQVVAGRGGAEYLDPARFFART